MLTGLVVLLGLMTALAGPARADDSRHPGPPTAVEITDTTVTVSWTPPTAPGEILYYQVVKNGGTNIGTTTGTTFTATGLVPNRVYSFAAVAYPRDGHPASSLHTRVRTTGTTPPMPAKPVVMGVFTEKDSHERGFHVKDLVTGGSAAKLTHLTYGYGSVDGGRCRVGDSHAALERNFTAANSVSGRADTANQPLRGYLNQLRELKNRQPQLKLLWSFGGPAQGVDWTAARQNPAAFAASCAQLLNDPRWAGLFDGIDLAVEFARCQSACPPGGPTTVTPLARELRKAVGNDRLLTVTIGRWGPAKQSYLASDLPEAAAHVDWYNVKTFDYYHPLDDMWAPRLAPHAPLDSSWDIWEWGRDVHSEVWGLTEKGIHPNKLVIGVPTHAWGWKGVTKSPWSDTLRATGPADGPFGPGLDDYRNVKTRCAPTGELGKTAVAHCGSEYWTYDTAATVTGKTAYMKENGMGGAFLSNLRGDTAGGELLTALSSGLTP